MIKFYFPSLRAVFILSAAITLSAYSASTEEINPFESNRIDAAVRSFENEHGRCAAVIMESATGRVVYVYDRELSLKRRFPPGSMAKPWAAAVLCDESGFTPFLKITCSGKFYPQASAGFSPEDERTFNLLKDSATGRLFFPCSKAKGHGVVSLQEALVRSCNCYFLTAVDQNRFYEKMIHAWHIDDLFFTGDDQAVVREVESVSKFQKLSSGIGEGRGILVSPLKAAENYAALFENTPLLDPFEGVGEPKMRHELNFSLQTRQLIKSALMKTKEDGTLHNLSLPSNKIILLAGKTGTATDLHDKRNHHGWNALWITVETKRYVLISFVLKGSGSKEAAELSSMILSSL